MAEATNYRHVLTNIHILGVSTLLLLLLPRRLFATSVVVAAAASSSCCCKHDRGHKSKTRAHKHTHLGASTLLMLQLLLLALLRTWLKRKPLASNAAMNSSALVACSKQPDKKI